MSTDKAFYQAPVGLETEAADAEPIEIEIVDPDEVTVRAGDLTITIDPDAEQEDAFNNNLAEEMDEGAMAQMASELIVAIDGDRASRSDWEQTYVEGLKLMGLHYENRTEPWAGACGVVHPMLTEAIVRFQSEMITETFPAQGPVRTKILGKETPEKKEAAVRVQDDMNYELTENMAEYRPEHERLLWSLPAAGSAFKKVYFDPSLGRQVAMFITAEDIILPYGTTELNTCRRITHVMRKTKNEIVKLQRAGFYRDFDIGEPVPEKSDIQEAKDKETGFSEVDDDRFTLLEVHVELDLEGFEDVDDGGEETGIALPYVVTILKDTEEVLAIRRNWLENDPLKLKRQHFVHYQYIPGFGAYGFGLFHLIGGYAKSATSLMRQLVDAGTLSNLPGGLKSRGLRIKGDDTPIAPGEFRDVDIGSGALRDNILPLPYKEPSQTLFQMLGMIVEEGRRFAATADVKVSDMSANSPVGSTLALLERQLKVMSAVQARLHYTLKQELKLLAGIIRDYTDDEYDYDPETAGRSAKKTDYDSVDIIPVSDPNAATMSQRVVQYQAVIQMAQMAPDIYDLPELHRQMLDVLGVKDAAKLVPLKTDFRPMDPVAENMALIRCEPVRAFQHQDHMAHIAAHQAFGNDPMIQQMVGQNPKAQQIQAAWQAHIAEHVAFEYRQRMEQQMGIPLPAEGEQLSPQEERVLAQAAAQAAQVVQQQNQQQVQQQEAQQKAQDPVLQLQQAQQALEERKVALEERKQRFVEAYKQQELLLKTGKAIDDSELKARQQDAAEVRDGVNLMMDVGNQLNTGSISTNNAVAGSAGGI